MSPTRGVPLPDLPAASDSIPSRTLGKVGLDAVVLGCGVLLVSALLHTRQFDGDGLRWLVQTRLERPSSGGISHPLFPALAWAWARVGTWTSIPALLSHSGVDGMVVWLQWLNALGAALGAAGFHVALRSLGIPRAAAALATVFLAASNAYLRASTDMIEPMWALALSCWALVVAARWGHRTSGALVAGGVLGLSGCIYLLALVQGLLLAGALMSRDQPVALKIVRVILAAASAIVVFAVGAFAALRVLGGVGKPLILGMESGVFGHIDPRHLVGAAIGLTNGLAPLLDWRGVSGLLHGPRGDGALNLVLCALAWCSLAAVGWVQARSGAASYRTLAAGMTLLLVFLFAAFWEAAYVKIWLFALPAFYFLLAATLPSRSVRLFALFPLGVLVLFSVGVALRRAVVEPADLVAARHLATRIGPQDLLVAPGWDGPSVYLVTLIRPAQPRFSLTDVALRCELEEPCINAELSIAVQGTASRRGRIFVFGLLDLPEADWQPFYGNRLRLRMTVLDQLRARALEQELVPGTTSHLTALANL